MASGTWLAEGANHISNSFSGPSNGAEEDAESSSVMVMVVVEEKLRVTVAVKGGPVTVVVTEPPNVAAMRERVNISSHTFCKFEQY